MPVVVLYKIYNKKYTGILFSHPFHLLREYNTALTVSGHPFNGSPLTPWLSPVEIKTMLKLIERWIMETNSSVWPFGYGNNIKEIHQEMLYKWNEKNAESIPKSTKIISSTMKAKLKKNRNPARRNTEISDFYIPAPVNPAFDWIMLWP